MEKSFLEHRFTLVQKYPEAFPLFAVCACDMFLTIKVVFFYSAKVPTNCESDFFSCFCSCSV